MKDKEEVIKVCLGVVINKSGQVLIVQRSKQEKGTDGSVLSWVFPGGKIKRQETKKHTVWREVLEETGYEVSVLELISSRKHPHFPVEIFYYYCELPNEKNTDMVSNEISDLKWVSIDKLGDFFTTDLDTGVKEFLDDIKK